MRSAYRPIRSIVKKQKALLLLALTYALTGCSSLTENFASLGAAELYKYKSTVIPALREQPPRVQLSAYKTIQARGNQHPDLAVAIATSGGGYRAANLTAGVLLGLEKLQNQHTHTSLLDEVDYFSSVSGSGFAIGLYLTYLKDRAYHNLEDHSTPKSFHAAMTMKQYDFKNRLRNNFSRSLFRHYLKTVQLEKKLQENFLTVNDTPPLVLSDLFVPANSHRKAYLPIWIPNATILQNRQLFQFTPDVLYDYQVTRYIHNGMIEDVIYNREKSGYAGEMPLSVGMMASATFPYAISGTTLWSSACDSTCHLQLFDGGLVDNLGLYTALDLLKQDQAKKKLLIIVDAFQGNDEPFSNSRFPPKRLALLQTLLLSSAGNIQRNIKQSIPEISKNLLCSDGTEQVMVVYLDLANHANLPQISNGLWISEEDQNLMLKVGQDMVAGSAQLNEELGGMLSNASIERC